MNTKRLHLYRIFGVIVLLTIFSIMTAERAILFSQEQTTQDEVKKNEKTAIADENDSIDNPGDKTLFEYSAPQYNRLKEIGTESKKTIISDEETLNNPRFKIINVIPDPLYLDFETSLGIAITKNFELHAIHAKKEIYNLSIWEKFRDFFPSLTISYLRSSDIAKREPDSRTHKLIFQSDWVLFDGGKRRLAYDVAKLQSILARNDYRIALNKLIMQVQESYLQTLQLKDTIAIHNKTLQRGNMQLAFIKKELELGEATKLNVMEIETKVKEIELNLEKVINDYQTSLNRFKMLLKLDWRQPIEIVGSIKNDYILYPVADKNDIIDFDKYISTALKNRKEVESTDVEFAINKRMHRINSLYYFPKFSIGLKYGLSDNEFLKNSTLPREREWGVNFKITSALFGNSGEFSAAYDETEDGNSKSLNQSGAVRILDQMDYKRKIVESKIEMLSSREKKRDIRQQISLEVATSIMGLEKAWKMIDIAHRRVELYDSLLEIERLKANMGETIRYELIKKEIERGEAAIQYLTAKVQYLVTSSYLEVSMGLNVGDLNLTEFRKKMNTTDTPLSP